MGKRRGRPEHVPDKKSRKFVEEMSAAGIPQEGIARTLDISEPTLRKHYRYELDTATARMVAKLATALYQKALTMADSAAVSAAIFILKCRGGWSDRPVGPPSAGAAAGVPLDAVDVWGGESGAPGVSIQPGRIPS